MGVRMTCATTPIEGVAQGGAPAHKTGLRHCATPCPPKGGRAGVAQPWHVQPGSAGVAHDLTPRGRLQIAAHMSALHVKAFYIEFHSYCGIFRQLLNARAA